MPELVMAAAEGGGGGGGIGAIVFMAIFLGIGIFVIAGVWKTFVKAGKPGWGVLVPIYNMVLLLEIAKKPIWWILLFFIPFVNFIVAILVAIEVAKSFGKGAGFGLGLAFLGPIFYPILGFGDAQYLGGGAPAAE